MFHYYVKFEGKSQGRMVGSGEVRVHGMGYGGRKITPATLNHTLLQIKAELGASNGTLIGKRQHKPLTITRETGTASPLLLNAHWANEVLSSLVIEIVGRPDTGKGEVVVSRITLTNAQISKVTRYTPHLQPHGQGPSRIAVLNTHELEEIQIVFQKITSTH